MRNEWEHSVLPVEITKAGQPLLLPPSFGTRRELVTGSETEVSEPVTFRKVQRTLNRSLPLKSGDKTAPWSPKLM